MKKYYIEVTETLQRIVAVEAEDLEQAMEQVEDWANEGEGLSYEDFVNRDFEDRTQYCENREPSIKDAFFTLPTVYTPSEIITELNDHIGWMYHHEPNLPWDNAMQSIQWFPERKGGKWSQYKLLPIQSYTYPDGRKHPVLTLRKQGSREILGYIAINRYNKIQAVENMLEVK